eukprot:scaffold44907_cov64-Phaeocystis_antarctica.AAC.2
MRGQLLPIFGCCAARDVSVSVSVSVFQILGSRNLADTFIATALLAATARAAGDPSSRVCGASANIVSRPA